MISHLAQTHGSRLAFPGLPGRGIAWPVFANRAGQGGPGTMGHPRARFVVPFVLLAGSVAALGQQFPRFPGQTREPPLADESEEILQARGEHDPDNPTTIRPAEHVVPAGPAMLPGSVVN